MSLLKQIALAGVISLVVFLPVVQVSSVCLRRSLTGFGRELGGNQMGFTDLLGKSETLSIIFIVLALICFISSRCCSFQKQNAESKSKWKLSVLFC
jgi:hypothetical protein